MSNGMVDLLGKAHISLLDYMYAEGGRAGSGFGQSTHVRVPVRP